MNHFQQQFGFCKGIPTENVLISLYQKILHNIDIYDKVVYIFFYHKRAFHLFNTKVLLSEILRYSIRGVSFNCFSTFLLGNSQRVVLKKNGIKYASALVLNCEMAFPKEVYLGYSCLL